MGTLFRVRGSVGSHYATVAARHGVHADSHALDRAFPHAHRAAVASTPLATRSGERASADADACAALEFWTTVIARTFAMAGAQSPPPTAVTELFAHFATANAWEELPGARAALTAIAALGLPQAVVSNFDGRLHAVIAALGLGPFVAVVVPTQLDAPKPHPDLWQRAAASMGVAARELLHIGDSSSEDGIGAAAVGARWLEVNDHIDVDRVLLHLGAGIQTQAHP